MNNMIFIAAGVVVLVGVFWVFKSKKPPKDMTKDPTEPSYEEPVLNLTHSNESKGSGLTGSRNGVKKGSIFDQVPNPLIKEKVANWQESSSYEDDIKNLDMDILLKEKESVQGNKDIIVSPPKTGFKPFILLVDDSLVVRKYVGDLLKKNDFEILLKNDGWEAISYLNAESVQRPDLIISDIEMPNMDGFQLINAIRKEKRYVNVPILVISAHAENHLKLMEDEAIQGFITKPFQDNDLIVQVNYLLEN